MIFGSLSSSNHKFTSLTLLTAHMFHLSGLKHDGGCLKYQYE